MAASAGRLWALSISTDGGATYSPVGGLRSRSFTANNTNVDVTTADSPGRWRELLGNAGIQSLDIDVSGIYQNDAGSKKFFQNAITSTIVTIRLATNGIQIDGAFLPDSYKGDGAYNEGATFELKLLSTGQPTFTYS